MPILNLVWCLALFIGLVFGLGLPFVASLSLRADEKLCAGAALALIAIYLFAVVVFLAGLPPLVFQLLPLAALAGFVLRWHACLAVLHAPDARSLLASYLMVASWCLGFLALVRGYSGGAWAGDWEEHWQRTLFFLHHWDKRFLFIETFSLPARPPLANLVTGGFLALTRVEFPWFQIFMTLLNSLAFLPGWLFAKRFGGASPRAAAFFTVLFMSSPSVMENSTFAWTKLIAVFLVLAGLYFLLQGMEVPGRGRLMLGFLLLAAAFLAHYSAGPYLVALIPAYCWWRRHQWCTRTLWIDTVAGALAGAALLATWFSWTIAAYGLRDTFVDNSSFHETRSHNLASFLTEKGTNLFNTLIPHPFRAVDYGFFAQLDRLGFVRDYCFQLYQVNLPLMFGSAGCVVLAWLLWRKWHAAGSAPAFAALPRVFWAWLVSATLVLGTAVYGGVDHWGISHLCLQSLLMLGLAFMAANTDVMPRMLRTVFLLGLVVDFALGAGLQFYLENRQYSVAGVLLNNGTLFRTAYGKVTWANLYEKIAAGYVYVGDWPIARPLLVTLLACLLVLALARVRNALRCESIFPPLHRSGAPAPPIPSPEACP
jgi:hypothetical protein